MNFGAEGGTRTPTPLRVHGPEPCASANSATTATVGYVLPGGRTPQPRAFSLSKTAPAVNSPQLTRLLAKFTRLHEGRHHPYPMNEQTKTSGRTASDPVSPETIPAD